MRSIEMSARTVEAAVEAACEALGVSRDDLNVSYEVLEFPARKFFKTIPAKVRVTVEEPEAEAVQAAAPAPEKTPDAPAAEAPAAPVEETPAAPAAEAPAETAADDEEKPLDIAADARLQAAVDYLTPVFTLMGVQDFTFSALQKGEATILRVNGSHMGALIGRRGETMESLSYLASLVVNRMEGPYVKLGLDVGGYRGKREGDLEALARRLAERVIRTGCYYEMEPMNPYERHIIHTAVAAIDGVRSESTGDGASRRVVIYSTDPDASNLPDRDNARNARGGHGRRDGRRRDGRDGRRNDRSRGRGGRGDRRRDNDRRYSGARGSAPAREFAETPRDPDAKPYAPKVTEHIHDGDDFAFGKIEL